MEHFEPSQRNKVKRIPKRGHYDKPTIYEVLDAGFICHVGFVMPNGQPFVIPTEPSARESTIRPQIGTWIQGPRDTARAPAGTRTAPNAKGPGLSPGPLVV